MYIVGYLDERCAGKILPFPETNGAALIQVHAGSQGKRVYHPKGLSCTLTARAGGMGGKTGLYEIGVPIKENTKKGYKIAYPGDSIDLGYAGMNTRRGRVGDQIAHTLTTGSTQGTIHVVKRNLLPEVKRDLISKTKEAEKPALLIKAADRQGVVYHGRIRRLTPRECLRLQGYYDWQIDRMVTDTSDNQLYKQAGNGVTVTVVEAIGRRLSITDSQIETEK